MNSVLVIFGLFILGLQDFNGNNGIAAGPTDDQTLVNLTTLLNGTISAEKGIGNTDYVLSANSVADLNEKIKENLKDGLSSNLKTTTIRSVNNYMRTGDVNRDAGDLIIATIKGLPTI